MTSSPLFGTPMFFTHGRTSLTPVTADYDRHASRRGGLPYYVACEWHRQCMNRGPGDPEPPVPCYVKRRSYVSRFMQLQRAKRTWAWKRHEDLHRQQSLHRWFRLRPYNTHSSNCVVIINTDVPGLVQQRLPDLFASQRMMLEAQNQADAVGDGYAH